MTNGSALPPTVPHLPYYERIINNLKVLEAVGALHPRIAYVGVAREFEVVVQEIAPHAVRSQAAAIREPVRSQVATMRRKTEEERAATEAARRMVRQLRRTGFLPPEVKQFLNSMFDRENRCAHTRERVTPEEVRLAVDQAIKLVHRLLNMNYVFQCSRKHAVEYDVGAVLDAVPGELVELRCVQCGECFDCRVPDPTEGPRQREDLERVTQTLRDMLVSRS